MVGGNSSQKIDFFLGRLDSLPEKISMSQYFFVWFSNHVSLLCLFTAALSAQTKSFSGWTDVQDKRSEWMSEWKGSSSACKTSANSSKYKDVNHAIELNVNICRCREPGPSAASDSYPSPGILSSLLSFALQHFPYCVLISFGVVQSLCCGCQMRTVQRGSLNLFVCARNKHS